MVCGEKVIGVKRSPTSRNYITVIFDGDVMFISNCFMIIYRIKTIDADLYFMLILCFYNDSSFLINVLYRVTMCRNTT